MLDKIISSLEALEQSLRRGASVNVNDQATKELVISLAKSYFSSGRKIIAETIDPDATSEIDEIWQMLVRLAHGNNARSSYRKVVTRLRKEMREFNIYVVASGGQFDDYAAASRVLTGEEILLLETLDRMIPSAAASYRQGLTDLRQVGRLSYRGTAVEFREALRETLDHLAPDNEIMAVAGFKLEANQHRPTTRQKVQYVLSSRGRKKVQRETAEKALRLADELTGELTRAIYNQASLATHVQQSKDEVVRIKRYVDNVLFDLLEIKTVR